MPMNPIFETENFMIRRLEYTDFESFHEMQGNEKVMQFVRGKPMTYEEDKTELEKLIKSYDLTTNDFWIFAIQSKQENVFLGTVALVKSDAHGEITEEDKLVINIKDDQCEIGYRLLEKYWGNGYAYEIAEGLISYCRLIGFKRLIGCVAYDNIASVKILEKLGFKFVKNFVDENLKIPEKKLELYL